MISLEDSETVGTLRDQLAAARKIIDALESVRMARPNGVIHLAQINAAFACSARNLEMLIDRLDRELAAQCERELRA